MAFLGGDLQLVTGSGPASYRWTGDALITIAGSAPVATHIAGYREGPRMPLPPIATPAPDEGESRNIGLAFVSPAATVLRDRSPVLRWRWSEPDARFDVTLLRADGAGAGTVVERWQALAGRSLVLWGPLDRGGRYRAIISLHGASALARVVSDEVAFAVLDGADAAALDEALAGLRAAATRAGGERPELQVLRARVFESYGLLAEAERAWAALALLYPERAELNAQARRLAREVRLR
ncbi:MAG: hypothetical protein EP329_09725 [Deltaproteobacteria bacterium]|nr:MAG: hypothetical protein EP329_09725 [Deltaproteobacteria bacterium]